MIFRYLQDKDIFESYYKHSFAKRLLNGRLTSEDNEKKMISKLKGECGHQYTQKLEGMLSDMSKSSEQTRQFFVESPPDKLGLEVGQSRVWSGGRCSAMGASSSSSSSFIIMLSAVEIAIGLFGHGRDHVAHEIGVYLTGSSWLSWS